jgi:hypothetical protein
MLPDARGAYGNLFTTPELINRGPALEVRKSLLNHELPLPAPCVKCANLAGVYGSVL